MPNPLDMLAELRDKLSTLPNDVADMVQRYRAVPAFAESGPMPLTAAVSGLAGQVAQQFGGAFPAAAQMGPAGPIPDAGPGPMTPAPYETPAPSPPLDTTPVLPPAPMPADLPALEPPVPAAVDVPGTQAPQAGFPQPAPLAEPTVAPDYGAVGGTAPVTPPDYGEALGGMGGGQDMTQVVSLLQEISARLGAGGGGGGGLPVRPMPAPQQVQWSSTWTPPQEGYALGASPSMDVSNVAGAGGASSQRGLGSQHAASRYWQPDTRGQTPR